MSHLHLPDGVLPVWLWAAGLLAAAAINGAALWFLRGKDLRRSVPRIGVFAGLMLVGMNLEIVPIAYHVNLAALAGIVLPPAHAVVAVTLVNLTLATMGHGGVTVTGVNATLLSIEALSAGLIYRLARRMVQPGKAAAASTFGSLILSTGAALGVIAAGGIDLGVVGEWGGLLGSRPGGAGFRLGDFAALLLPLAAVGWVIETVVSASLVRFLVQVRPHLIEPPPRKAGP
ncbi:MAG: hypothetical protein A2V83_01320 [Nitrospirae bacterium RBG_16_64_22]|nr:MAG: hypothetical protein A2V83_01320 [Nitrospirae bacterium RBG_16_64_22]